eukprot:UN25704
MFFINYLPIYKFKLLFFIAITVIFSQFYMLVYIFANYCIFQKNNIHNFHNTNMSVCLFVMTLPFICDIILMPIRYTCRIIKLEEEQQYQTIYILALPVYITSQIIITLSIFSLDSLSTIVWLSIMTELSSLVLRYTTQRRDYLVGKLLNIDQLKEMYDKRQITMTSLCLLIDYKTRTTSFFIALSILLLFPLFNTNNNTSQLFIKFSICLFIHLIISILPTIFIAWNNFLIVECFKCDEDYESSNLLQEQKREVGGKKIIF